MRKHMYYQKNKQELQIDYWYPTKLKTGALAKFCRQLSTFGFQKGALEKRITGTPGYSFKSINTFGADFTVNIDGSGNKYLIINVRAYQHGELKSTQQLRIQLYKIAEHLENEFKIMENKLGEFYIYYNFFKGLEKLKE